MIEKMKTVASFAKTVASFAKAVMSRAVSCVRV